MADIDVSIVVPVAEDPEGLRTTVNAVLAQTYDAFELLVVIDDESSECEELAESIAAREDRIYYYIEDEHGTAAAARNIGIREAAGDYLLFVDANVDFGPRWLSTLVDTIGAETDIVGCAVTVYSSHRDTVFGRLDQQTGFPTRRTIEQLKFAPSCCLLVARAVVEDIGEFDPRLNQSEDLEFGNRAYAGGYSFAYFDERSAYHPSRSSFTALTRKYRRRAAGTSTLCERYPDRYGPDGDHLRPEERIVPPLSGFKRTCRNWEDLSSADRVTLYAAFVVVRLTARLQRLAR
ncbi:glycosyltransferase [Halosimplex marinum]|uniref:glycosyltransferase n=1 Tax=Halosimplex marinum TaxID=3396620 RepID=UPI003F56F3E6